MTIEDIMEMWGEDSHIDDKDLDNESLNIPNKHQKYLNIYFSTFHYILRLAKFIILYQKISIKRYF